MYRLLEENTKNSFQNNEVLVYVNNYTVGSSVRESDILLSERIF